MRSLYQDFWLIIIDKIEGIYQVESLSFVQCILSGARGEIGASVVLSFGSSADWSDSKVLRIVESRVYWKVGQLSTLENVAKYVITQGYNRVL